MDTKLRNIKEKKNNSLILVWNIALWYQAIRYIFILIGVEEYLGIVLKIIIAISVVLFLYGITYNYKIIIKRDYTVVIPIVFGLILIMSYIYNNSNEYIRNYLVNYFQYMFIPLIALIAINKESYRNFIRIYFDFAIVFFVVLGFSPFLYPGLFTNDMAYGFAISLPCGIAFYIGRHYLNKKWIIPFEIACYIMGIVSSTRSTILSFVFMIVICNLILHKTTVKRALLYMLGLITGLVLYFNLLNILNFLIDFLRTKYNYYSRSLSFLYMGITGDTRLTGGYGNFYSGRDIIQEKAFNVFETNFLTGVGIGGFESRYGMYSHNILFDFALVWGVLGIIVFVIIVIYSTKTILRVEKGDISYQTGLLLLLLCLWCPKLFFSLTFVKDLGFWSFIIFCIKVNQNKRLLSGKEAIVQQ